MAKVNSKEIFNICLSLAGLTGTGGGALISRLRFLICSEPAAIRFNMHGSMHFV